ncbi:MAG: transcriptional regulator [Gammaproteobacteria bacterium]|nr:MAG: transcriptional regulator [Gammaproteobacteria bacterium]RLA45581.1 MAG: transcriptional regulator [Gammaproteobacteria bacterium]
MQKAITSKKYADLINWLKQARLDQKMGMRQLALRLDKPHSFVQKVEMLERRLDVYEYTYYCSALNLDPCVGLKYLS